jgi:CheY-like chemotaxis protein
MKTVLIVDDEYAIVEALQVLLEDAGYKVLTAQDGREALRLLGEQPADAIILDVMMPVMDGLQFILRKRDIPALAQTPTILVSATPEPAIRAQLSAAGTTASVRTFLRKPYSAEAILHALAQALRTGG